MRYSESKGDCFAAALVLCGGEAMTEVTLNQLPELIDRSA
jgi:hypothetical protein